MKTAIMQIAVAAALGAAAPRALATNDGQPVKHAAERRPAAQVRSANEVLASWTGSVPGTAAGAGGGSATTDRGRAPRPDPLASWTGTLPSARPDGQGARAGGGDLRGARPLGAARVLASWSGSF